MEIVVHEDEHDDDYYGGGVENGRYSDKKDTDIQKKISMVKLW